jgi:GNAT superfamily N-acetyltransferase
MSHRDATPADLQAIDRVFRESFCDTFAHLYATSDLDQFLAKFTSAAWRAEYDDPRFRFRVAEADGQVVGYAKLGPLTLPVDADVPAIELRQLYILKAYHGAGIAHALMDWALGQAPLVGAREVYLTVFTENHRARRFYDRYGFEAVGRYAFMVGTHADEDIIMRKRL